MPVVPSCLLIFHGGAEEAVADVGPAEVHPKHGERDGEESRGRGPDGPAEVVGVGGDGAGAEGGDGEADEEGEGGSRGDEAGAVVLEVGGGPGEGEGGGERLVLVHRLLLPRDRALRLRRGSFTRGGGCDSSISRDFRVRVLGEGGAEGGNYG